MYLHLLTLWKGEELGLGCSISLPTTGNRNTRSGQGKLDEADALLVRAIKIQEKAFGPNHPSLADSLGTRATVLEAKVWGV